MSRPRIYGCRIFRSFEMGRYAYERIVAKSASVRSCKQKLHRISPELSSGSMPGIDGLLISKFRADFLDICFIFSLQVRRALTIGSIFCELEKTWMGKTVIRKKKKKTRNRGLDCRFFSFGTFGVFAAGQCAYKRIVTMS